MANTISAANIPKERVDMMAKSNERRFTEVSSQRNILMMIRAMAAKAKKPAKVSRAKILSLPRGWGRRKRCT